MSLKFFITGTDTHVGKTYVTLGMLKAFARQGLVTLGLKPLASGSEYINNKLVNEDAMRIREASSLQLPYESINPVAFAPPIAPHIAAEASNVILTAQKLYQKIEAQLFEKCDVCLVEGVGGWYVPLNRHETMADFVKLTSLPVILIVSIRLGCINHTLLTASAIETSGCTLRGWVANCMDPAMIYVEENIDYLQNLLAVPLLGKIGYQENPVEKLDVDSLLGIQKVPGTL